MMKYTAKNSGKKAKRNTLLEKTNAHPQSKLQTKLEDYSAVHDYPEEAKAHGPGKHLASKANDTQHL